ncbi:hypothetical protein L3X38_043676 [Prunus dulcis]|uniref:Uncharacterized protein n=1 Tax=Prunus dulcis TaxID=3755 RepID=A0AAD4YMG8_PRUDU|nr:hypothetical protein L3X38_043676 [Prunus dulcis]
MRQKFKLIAIFLVDRVTDEAEVHNHLDCDYCLIKYFSVMVACADKPYYSMPMFSYNPANLFMKILHLSCSYFLTSSVSVNRWLQFNLFSDTESFLRR